MADTEYPGRPVPMALVVASDSASLGGAKWIVTATETSLTREPQRHGSLTGDLY